MKLLGIDYGRKKIGLALGDENLKLVTPFRSIPNNNLAQKNIVHLVNEYGITKIVIGLPLTLRGNEGQRAKEVREFAKNLRSILPDTVEIVFWDERFTTQEAYRYLEAYNWRKKREYKDSISAFIILSEYLEAI